MENDEDRGPINKKVSEDQWVKLGQFSFLALSLFFLSLSFSWRLRVSWTLLEGLAYLDSWSKKAKKEQGSIRGHWDQRLWRFLLAGIKSHVFHTSYSMHGIYMRFFGHDMSLAWRISSIKIWIFLILPFI